MYLKLLYTFAFYVFSMLSLDILDLWVYLGLCAWHLQILFGKGGTCSSQRSQESDTARWCPWSVLRGNSREADSDTPFRSLTVHVLKAIHKVELGSCPANLFTYHFRKCSGTLPSTSAGASEELRLFGISIGQYHPFLSKHEFCSTDMDLFQQRLWHLELMSSIWMNSKWFWKFEHGHQWMIDWGKQHVFGYMRMWYIIVFTYIYIYIIYMYAICCFMSK